MKIGTRVMAMAPHEGKTQITSKVGTVIGFNRFNNPLIEFDEPIGGHDGLDQGVKGKSEHCWYVPEVLLSIVPETYRPDKDILRIRMAHSVSWHFADPPTEVVRSSPTGLTKFMGILKEIPAKIKRVLNENYRAFYQLGYVNEQLEVTPQGSQALNDFLVTKFEDEFGKYAQKELVKIKKQAKKEDE